MNIQGGTTSESCSGCQLQEASNCKLNFAGSSSMKATGSRCGSAASAGQWRHPRRQHLLYHVPHVRKALYVVTDLSIASNTETQRQPTRLRNSSSGSDRGGFFRRIPVMEQINIRVCSITAADISMVICVSSSILA